MKIGSINILTDQKLENYREANIKANVRAITILIARVAIPELKRLKDDHWDKFAFDRLIKFFEDLQNAKN